MLVQHLIIQNKPTDPLTLSSIKGYFLHLKNAKNHRNGAI